MSFDDPSILIVDRLPLPDDYRVFVHPTKLGELKFKNGTFVEIRSENNKTVCAQVHAVSESCSYGCIQIGRALRINLQCYLGQRVQIKRARDCDTAECVVLAPIEDTISNITGTYADILFRSAINFDNLPLKKNQIIPVFALNRVIEFKVVITQPTNTVVVDNIDVIACRNTTVSRGNSPRFDKVCYDDIGGLNFTLKKIRQVIEIPLLQPKLYRSFNLPAVKNILITANSGCGKTLISQAIRNETPANYLRIDCYNLLTKTVEEAIAFLLKSIDEVVSNQPSIVYFDDFDVVASPEINEDSNPDSRISNALCSAIKRMRAEKSIVVIASARDDSRIRKDIKAKFDRKINILYPISDEKLSIIRTIVHRYSIRPNTTVDDIAATLVGKSSAQLTQACLRSLAKPIADLAARKDKENDKDKDKNEPVELSINQLRQITISPLQTNDDDDLFEDTSFDNPKKYKVSRENNTEAFDKMSKQEQIYDPEYECYNNYAQPEKPKQPLDFEFINMFENEPPYNEGMVDNDRKRYTYDDENDYYSDDYDRKRPPSKNRNRNTKNIKNKRNRYNDDDYYSDYYEYSDDYPPSRNNKKSAPSKPKQNSKQKPSRRNGKAVGKKGKNYEYYSDEYYSDYYSDDEGDCPRKKQPITNKQSQNEKPKRKVDPFVSKDDISQFPSKKATGFPTKKGDLVNPFAEKEKSTPLNIPTKKKPVLAAEDDSEKNEAPNNKPTKNPFGNNSNNSDNIRKKKNNRVNDYSSDDEKPKQQPTKKKQSKIQNDYSDDEVKKPARKNPFLGNRKRIMIDDDGSEQDEQPKSRNPTRKDPFSKDLEKHDPFNNNSKDDTGSSDDETPKTKPSKEKKSSNKKAKRNVDDYSDPSDEENIRKTKNVKNNNPFRKSRQVDDESESEDEKPNSRKKPNTKNPFAKKNSNKRNPFASKSNSDSDDDDDDDEPPRRATKKKHFVDEDSDDDFDEKKRKNPKKNSSKRRQIDSDEEKNERSQKKNRKAVDDSSDYSDEPQPKRINKKKKNPFA
ncbi:hypothetical protein TRFO_21628 [Tritrichomonas foetus]|uniref:CDC48 N-terminal subdomain domain-containing protein n=1 Tax=Tritrichomonas foetus TaxID=1144522 RepID=A0A1J4KEG7_9EUKA|nr:hypothetical protein TRFO_21628 [Tritrichomonas foetus]|eukprot:OHT09410.1 hypothetical protein TRFO_21628 [Tritrichomonas foetus]